MTTNFGFRELQLTDGQSQQTENQKKGQTHF